MESVNLENNKSGKRHGARKCVYFAENLTQESSIGLFVIYFVVCSALKRILVRKRSLHL